MVFSIIIYFSLLSIWIFLLISNSQKKINYFWIFNSIILSSIIIFGFVILRAGLWNKSMLNFIIILFNSVFVVLWLLINALISHFFQIFDFLNNSTLNFVISQSMIFITILIINYCIHKKYKMKKKIKIGVIIAIALSLMILIWSAWAMGQGM